MAMKFVKNQAREVSVNSAKFVAFTSTSGVYPDVLVWERTESGWTPIAWVDSPDSADAVSSEDLELELLTREGGSVLLGEDCTRHEFYEYVFGSDAFAESEFSESDPQELGFESDSWFPAQMQEPGFLMSNNDYLVEYHEGLDWEESEAEVRKDLDVLDEDTRVELYGSSYRA